MYVFFFFFRKVKKGSLLIDSSTIDPAVSKEMAAASEKMGAVFMDAPVSGGKYYVLAEIASLNILSGFIILPDSWLGDVKLQENLILNKDVSFSSKGTELYLVIYPGSIRIESWGKLKNPKRKIKLIGCERVALTVTHEDELISTILWYTC